MDTISLQGEMVASFPDMFSVVFFFFFVDYMSTIVQTHLTLLTRTLLIIILRLKLNMQVP